MNKKTEPAGDVAMPELPAGVMIGRPYEEVWTKTRVLAFGHSCFAAGQTEVAAKNTEITALKAERDSLLKVATRVLCDTEVGHRPPVRDRLETGRTVRVRIAALADLHDAVVAINPAFNQPVTPEESARLTKALAQMFGWEKP